MSNTISLVTMDGASRPFPFVQLPGRICYAIPYGAQFGVRVNTDMEVEVVIAVDGRDTQTNKPASQELGGVVIRGPYVCPGFQTSSLGAASFVHVPKGRGLTTSERNGTEDACGLVAVAFFEAARRDFLRSARSNDAHVMRGVEPTRGGTRGMSSGGAMAGEQVANPLGQIEWRRGSKIAEGIAEYDTREGWIARGLMIPDLNESSAWPGAAPRFAPTSTL